MLRLKRRKPLPTMGEPRRVEQYLPVRRSDLVDRLLACQDVARSLSEDDKTAFRRLAYLLAATLGHEFHIQLQRLKDDYAPFDPDADTHRPGINEPADQTRLLDDLVSRLTWLLERANFHRLSRADIEAATAEASHWGVNLRVSFELFDRLEVFYRGEGTKSRRTPRRWFGLRRGIRIPVETYERLVVLLRMKEARGDSPGEDTNSVHLKLFKDIPKLDLEMLLPGTRVSMSLWDRIKLSFSLSTGFGMTGYKLFGPVVALMAGVYNTIGLLGIASGAVGYGVRSLYGYIQTKQKYLLTLAQSLYFLNLDNNAGVLFRLLDEAEEQEARETLLGYYLLLNVAGEEGWTEAELDAKAESWIASAIGRSVDFDSADSLLKLKRLRLVEELPQGRWRAVTPADAVLRLDRNWDGHFSVWPPPDGIPPTA